MDNNLRLHPSEIDNVLNVSMMGCSFILTKKTFKSKRKAMSYSDGALNLVLASDINSTCFSP